MAAGIVKELDSSNRSSDRVKRSTVTVLPITELISAYSIISCLIFYSSFSKSACPCSFAANSRSDVSSTSILYRKL